jgi:hypothetical protein
VLANGLDELTYKAFCAIQELSEPGITVLPKELGRRTWTLKRPDVYFRADWS